MSDPAAPDETKPRYELRYHAAMPGWVKILGLDIRAVPECEGDGFKVPEADGNRLVDGATAIEKALAEQRAAMLKDFNSPDGCGLRHMLDFAQAEAVAAWLKDGPK